ncbi:SusC/RagA family TonB-linked outer membrane protein [Pedobacter sp. ASV1-7]|uniref:SusC/RagA family TonB-linked outer membrane protein n=1 Tax=Pedobacter sp. ASV1-7 TaxID=3145237 RepID=UPI0032E8E90B
MKKSILIIVMATLCLFFNANAQQQPTTLSGKITNQKRIPISGSTIRIEDEKVTALSNSKGEFTIVTNNQTGTLQITNLGYKSIEISFNTRTTGPYNIILTEDQSELKEVEIVSTGYQTLSKEKTTGSFTVIDKELIDRKFSTDILSRLDGVTSGLVFNKGIGNPKTVNMTIRGLSTIMANSQPLIILDNFEYDGDIRNINPNDIKTITVLKDASAASIWGAKAGNGVIVITTNSGKYNAQTQISASTTLSVTGKPNLFSNAQISSSDYIDLEEYLFDNGFYNTILTAVAKTSVSPAVEIFVKRKAGQILPTEATAQLEALRKIDTRNDLSEYFYRKSLSQQYAFNISGGSNTNRYYASAGWDKNLEGQKGNGYDRLTLNLNNTYQLIKDKLELTSGIIFTKSTDLSNYTAPIYAYPYASFADENGNALPIARYRQTFIDTAGKGKLLDWNYRPLDELNLTDNTLQATDYRINAGLKFSIIPGLNLNIKYQYGKSQTEGKNHYNPQTFMARDYINQFSTINLTTGAVNRPVPLGGILDLNNQSTSSHRIRSQLDYAKTWNSHDLSIIGGAEINDLQSERIGSRLYGYDDEHAINSPVDLIGNYRSYVTGRQNLKITNRQDMKSLTDRYLSFYTNAAYTYKNKYMFTASMRKDASNLFGVNTNQKWVPLYSIGAGWNISEEAFFKMNKINRLKIRASYGYSGNVDKSVSAYLVAQAYVSNSYNLPTQLIKNPPNPDLRWERIRMINLGTDFSAFENRISGSLDYYLKKGFDMIGEAELASSTGLASFKGNTAGIKGSGLDLVLNSQNTNGAFKWNTSIQFSIASDEVTEYRVQPANISSYIVTGAYRTGKPVYALYSYQNAGLDPQTGDPRAYHNGNPSSNYSEITGSVNASDMIYNGPSRPPVFGGFRNTFNWKDFSLSFNLVYKFGYYFRRPSLNYSSLFSGNASQRDYQLRWQKPGDETKTSVPSMIYPANPLRDQVYTYSSSLVEKADHIRLQDVQIGYDINRQRYKGSPFQNVRFYLYASNISLLWRANDSGIDPDSPNTDIPLSIAGGLRFTF